jgi:hypothetical protein
MEGATARMSAKAREAALRRTLEAAIRRRLGCRATRSSR